MSSASGLRNAWSIWNNNPSNDSQPIIVTIEPYRLTGVSTASAYNFNSNKELGVPVFIRGPYNAAIHDLGLAALLFQAAATTERVDPLH